MCDILIEKAKKIEGSYLFLFVCAMLFVFCSVTFLGCDLIYFIFIQTVVAFICTSEVAILIIQEFHESVHYHISFYNFFIRCERFLKWHVL